MANAGSNSWLGEPAGQSFGQYTVLRRLGAGGMAETFEAVRHGPGGFSQRVCLKLVLPSFRGREDFMAAFEREARLAARLRHSNIVGILDYGQVDGVSYMAIELIDGVDLSALLESHPDKRLPYDHVALLGHEIAAALEHAHDPHRAGPTGEPGRAIVHRDISPSNIMISKVGEVLLTDFGVAKAVSGTAHQQSAVKGKVPYMSPEHLRADAIDGRADLFSLGVCLYEALAGVRPFVGGNDPATILQILNGEHPSLHSLIPTAPKELCAVIERMIEADPDDRPTSGSEVRDQLHPFLPPPSVGRELGRMAAETRKSVAPATPHEPTSGVSPTGDRSDPSHAPIGEGPTEPATPHAVLAQSTPASKSRRRPWAILLLLAVILGGGFFALRGADPATTETPIEPAEETSEATPPATKETAETDQGPAADPEPPAETTAAVEAPPPEQPARVTPARLSVIVFPWGEVWINGKPRGPGPLQNVALKPGRYRIAAGRGSPAQTKTIRLREGQRETVRFNLTE
ncbi:MAG: protein kinase [Myxococcota bacterium]